MATQVKVSNSPSGEYVVIDNGAAPAANTVSFDGAAISYDTIKSGATAQSTNPFTNGTIPDCAALTRFGPLVANIQQKTGGSSTGSVASLVTAFGSNNTLGNSIVVVCGVGNGTAPTISDTQLNSYSSVAQVANGTAFNVAIVIATNCKAGANTVTVNNGGAAASIAMEIYEFANFITASNILAIDSTSTNTSGAAASSPAVTVAPGVINEFSVAAFGLGTAAQTITVGGYNNDSGQLNPTTPAGLFSFASASLALSTTAAQTPSASVGVAEPWAVAAATFRTATPANTVKTGMLVVNSLLSTR